MSKGKWLLKYELLWLANLKAPTTHWIDFKSKSLFGLTSSTAGPECIHNLFGSTELRSEAYQMNHLVKLRFKRVINPNPGLKKLQSDI